MYQQQMVVVKFIFHLSNSLINLMQQRFRGCPGIIGFQCEKLAEK
jgi:hypothetical protein